VADGGVPVGLDAPDAPQPDDAAAAAPPAGSLPGTSVPSPTDQELARLADEASPFVRLAMVEDVFNLARANSLWGLTFGLACCAIEMMAAGAARYDLDRFGVFFRPSPRQADLMILAGTISRKMAPVIKTLWEQMPEPKWAISMGGCTISGGPFKYPGEYAISEGAEKFMPIDVHVPGCPPRPEALIAGILKLEEKIKQGRRFERAG
jgi:NADH-quinone oxidoreductase subunit B